MIDSFQDSGILDPVDSYTAKSQLQVFFRQWNYFQGTIKHFWMKYLAK